MSRAAPPTPRVWLLAFTPRVPDVLGTVLLGIYASKAGALQAMQRERRRLTALAKARGVALVFERFQPADAEGHAIEGLVLMSDECGLRISARTVEP